MRDETCQRLLAINKEFYQSFGQAFAETRQRIQPGVARALAEWISPGDWLDIGCGSGTLAKTWIKNGVQASYFGLDFSSELLEVARGQVIEGSVQGVRVRFVQADLMKPDWVNFLPINRYTGVLAFAVLHHIPGRQVRKRLAQQIADMLLPGGLFIHSNWQFQNSPKLLARIQTWQGTHVDEQDLEEGDTLLDWRHAASGQDSSQGLRYVHLFSKEELHDLAADTGFSVLAAYDSDGTGGKLGHYQVWEKN